MRLPRFFNFENYKVQDVKEFLSEGRVEIFLSKKKESSNRCHRCHHVLTEVLRGDHFMKVEALPIMGHKCFLIFRRYKYHCSHCKKARSEKVDFYQKTPRI